MLCTVLKFSAMGQGPESCFYLTFCSPALGDGRVYVEYPCNKAQEQSSGIRSWSILGCRAAARTGPSHGVYSIGFWKSLGLQSTVFQAHRLAQ